MGLIAGLTVPSIVVAVDKSRTTAQFKEAQQIIKEIMSTGYQNGDFQNITSFDIVNQKGAGSIVDYFTKKLNYSKQCFTGDQTSRGCTNFYPGYFSISNHNGRWILPSGTSIKFHDGSWVSMNGFGFEIVAKPNETMVVSGENANYTSLFCNPSDTPILYWGSSSYPTVKPGTCLGGV